MQAWSRRSVSKDDWEKKLAAVKIYKEDMNKLVMNFLVTEASASKPARCLWCNNVALNCIEPILASLDVGVP